MRRLLKLCTVIIMLLAFFAQNGLGQNKSEQRIKRAAMRRATHTRDSLLRSINKSDTSVSSLLRRVEQYTTTYNQIKNTLADGLDTADISLELPPVIKRIDKITVFGDTHKASTLRYLFVLRDNLDHMQGQLDDWQSDMADISVKLVQNQSDLLKITKDSLFKIAPKDSAVRATFFVQLKALKTLYHKVDSTNRCALLKVTLLQDKISVSYTKILDESDHIDAKIKGFAIKAISGESTYIWQVDNQYNDFKSAFNSTIRLNKILFNYFIRSAMVTHAIAILFLVFVFSWLLYNRSKVLRLNEQPETIFSQANYIYKNPVISPLLVVTAITPYFYDHPPAVFLEIIFVVSIILTLILIKKDFHKTSYRFLILLFALTVIYSISNLFIELSNIDRYIIFILSIICSIAGYRLHKKVKASPDDYTPHTGLAVKTFIILEVLSMLLNISGRFSLAKIIGITAVFNMWLLLILYLVVNIIIEGLYLQFEVKKGGNSFFNWIDYKAVEKKFKTTLIVVASMLWLFFLLQNLTIDDWAVGTATDIFNQSQTIGGASFTFGGFLIFIFVIWLSSVVSKIISYFYDVAAQRVSDLSVAKKRNRTSTLLIRMGVFSIGFFLAVAASGFPLEKLTIIISAFGVGIGFGLQNIVNNLVSGLILAFEKPIQIGDVIEVDGVAGTMREIGIRSSKIATGDGSEVIIPNGDLISHHVINWTLSNNNRRIELIIGVAYGSDIEKVKDLLNGLLTSREDIMQEPKPLVFVHNLNESTVDFRLLFWAADIATWLTLKSNILTEIYTLFDKEGIEIPYPTQDLHLILPKQEALPEIAANKNPADPAP